ncbi:restriction endonuclease [Streptomyces sp. NPDC002886]|uniref:restriction endonuclease n=1 Tax=Streptomyces sp. NPDC002886 TaxID=3364667 RepID=UPI0036D02140
MPVDREVHLRLAAAVLGWTAATVPPAGDVDLAALELTGHARVLQDELITRAAGLRSRSEHGDLSACSLADTGRRLSAASSGRGALADAQGRARLVQGLHQLLDRLE